MIEDSFDFSSIFSHSVPNIVDQVEDNNRPGSIDGIKSFGENGSREDCESDNEGEHNDKRVG